MPFGSVVVNLSGLVPPIWAVLLVCFPDIFFVCLLISVIVWSMPGGFTSSGREGYQTVDEEPFIRNVRPTPPAPHRPGNVAPPADVPTAPGAYQAV
jgi:hypothetical protein